MSMSMVIYMYVCLNTNILYMDSSIHMRKRYEFVPTFSHEFMSSHDRQV